DLPAPEARRLLRSLTELEAQLAEARVGVEARDEQRSMLESVRPAAFEPSDTPVVLDSSGWGKVQAFLTGRMQELHRGRSDALARATSLDERRTTLAEDVRALLSSHAARVQLRISLRGDGPARVVLSYEVRSARWSGEYLVQYLPDRGQLALSYAALVTQASGEDWSGVPLTVTTARPDQFERAPELMAWRLADVERFVPTPTPLTAARQASPSAPALPALATESDVLRRRLEQRIGSIQIRVAGPPPTVDVGSSMVGGTVNQEFVRNLANSRPSGLAGANRSFDSLASTSPADLASPAGTSVLTGAVVDASTKGVIPGVVVTVTSPTLRGEQMGETDENGTYRLPGLPPGRYVVRFERASYRPYSRSGVDVAPERILRLNVELLPEMAGAETVTVLGAGPAADDLGPLMRTQGLLPPQTFVDLAPRTGGEPPDSDGLDLSFDSARPERVRSGSGAARVTLVSERWPVQIERRAYPALTPHVYLVGRTRNPSPRVLPGGTAVLSVGSDPTGHARLPVLRPEDEVELPLGIDHSLRPVRNVLLKASSRGLFSKDDLSEVKVSVEIANPHARLVQLSVIEQLPVANGEKVEVEVLEVTPTAKRGDGGRLEWNVRLPARGKTVLAYRYRIVRPKGWELRQSEGDPR
ncbi:MAG TPA: DUF4139 domain-containing protein, partial [Myxococcaceae bacterium]|nr:DUF4139 domain-containing protein [Myxococcaceae bacterium]